MLFLLYFLIKIKAYVIITYLLGFDICMCV